MSAEMMDYWVRISQRGTALGGGFILTPHLALTAAHCLKHMYAEDEDVELTLGTGEEIPGRVCELAAVADLALIVVLKPFDRSWELPCVDLAVHGDTWIAPYRPGISDPQLQGQVVSGAVSFRCAAGAEIEALQLTCSQHVGSFYGYSGGPIQRHHGDAKPTLFGVLLEQYLDRQDGNRVSDVLFAATMREVLRRFRYLGMGHLLNVLSEDETVPDEHSAVRAPRPTATPGPSLKPDLPLPDQGVESRIADADSRIRAIQAWTASGVLSPEKAEPLILSIAWELAPGGIMNTATHE